MCKAFKKTRGERVEIWVRNRFTQAWESDRHIECQVPTEGCKYVIDLIFFLNQCF